MSAEPMAIQYSTRHLYISPVGTRDLQAGCDDCDNLSFQNILGNNKKPISYQPDFQEDCRAVALVILYLAS